MLSQKARYALRALIHLARENSGRNISVSEIAAAEKLPRKFLEEILHDMKLRGFVTSRRGKAGGYVLAMPAGDISFADVLRAIDGPLALYPCASRTAYRKCEDCFDVETCPIRAALLAARDESARILENWSLETAASVRVKSQFSQ
jgi:Rrf2 family protein